MKILDSRGIERDSSDMLAADRLIKMKSDLLGTDANGVWQVIEECIKIWTERHPKQWRSYLIELDSVRKTRHDSKFAQSYDKDTHKKGTLRYTLDFPEPIMKMIRYLYNPDELPMDREFFLKMARKFPMFKVAQKL